MPSILEKLTENTEIGVQLRKKVAAMRAKWEDSGLLEGLQSERMKDNISVLLENQAKELLREISTMHGGDVEGFAAVAFPMVRRVFGGLVANEIVSVQPMNLPTGLIFFMDFQKVTARLGDAASDSVYGGGVVGLQITGGVSLVGANIEKGFYNLNNGYSSPTGSATVTWTVVASGTVGDGGTWTGDGDYKSLGDRLVQYDPDLGSGTTAVAVFRTAVSGLSQLNLRNLVGVTWAPTSGRLQRRLTRIDPVTGSVNIIAVVAASGTESTDTLGGAGGSIATDFPMDDNFTTGNGLGSTVGTTLWGLENDPNIPEIDIKVDSVDIRAKTKKLKAKWTPELAQDINAYQNIDAEVELTSILSELIALEIDMELLVDLVKHATAGTYYWSRRPGTFLNRPTGARISTSANEALLGADFTGNVSEWYETLIETINDVSAQIHRKTLRGGANFIVCGPEVANILEFTAGFRASATHDEDTGEVGAIKIGSLRKKWDVYVSPYFYRNLILVGRKGSSFLESGYVYAPYVPLQITPTMLGQEDGVPRKIVSTRYGKKMVRPDFYGLVIVENLLN